LACQHAEGAQKPPDLSLQLDPDLHHGVTRCEQRADFVAGAGLDLDLPEPACAHDLRQPGRIVAVGLVGPHLESNVGVTRVKQMTGSARACSSFQSQTAIGPVSRPTRARSTAFWPSQAVIASGQVGSLASLITRPVSSTRQTQGVSCETSRAA